MAFTDVKVKLPRCAELWHAFYGPLERRHDVRFELPKPALGGGGSAWPVVGISVKDDLQAPNLQHPVQNRKSSSKASGFPWQKELASGSVPPPLFYISSDGLTEETSRCLKG